MVTMRRAVGLVLAFGLFVVCLVVSSHTPTLAQGAGEKKHPVIHKSIRELRAAHKNLKALKPHFGGHREKAMEDIDRAIKQLHEAIKVANREAKK